MAASKTSRHIRWVAAAGLLLLIAYIITAHLLPFDPFHINRYEAIPASNCMGVSVNINLNYTLEHPRFGKAKRYEGVTYWQEVDGTSRTPDQPFAGSFAGFKTGTHTIPSPVIRLAPPEVGTWSLVTEVETSGRELLWPRYAETRHVSGAVLETLPADHPRCIP